MEGVAVIEKRRQSISGDQHSVVRGYIVRILEWSSNGNVLVGDELVDLGQPIAKVPIIQTDKCLAFYEEVDAPQSKGTLVHIVLSEE